MSSLQELRDHFAAALLSTAADLTWRVLQPINRMVPEGELPHPEWAPARLMKSRERSRSPLGVPRTTDSVCPKCVVETRDGIVHQRVGVDVLKHNPGLIKADILEEAGRVLMRKGCSRHGPFEDVLASNAEFFRRMESMDLGCDFECAEDSGVHDHGVWSIRSGAPAFLIVDLTNRCNMKCSPCFMDANNQGYVHELELAEIKAAIDQALTYKPRREFNILFSGGEPTLSPHFLDAVRYAKGLGLQRLHVATNGIRFAQDAQYAQEARAAGLHGVYLQFDGVSEARNRHRGVDNLLEVKLQALENIAAAGMRVMLQSTVINGINDDGVWSVVDFAIRNIDKVFSVVFQPIMFAGRDENVDDEIRYRQRYTLSQLAEDLQAQSGADWQPLRDWFPTSVFGALGNLLDAIAAPDAKQGSVCCTHHPDTSVFSALVVNRRTKAWAPLSAFFNVERFLRDIDLITSTAHGKAAAYIQMALSVLRNYRGQNAPTGFTVKDLLALFEQANVRSCTNSPDWTPSDLIAIRLISRNIIYFAILWRQDNSLGE